MTIPVMIFAAGFGTRMRPLTDTTPKPLLKLGDKTLVDHAVDIARSIEPDRIVVNAHYLAEQVVAHFDGTDVHVLVERGKILDTGGGLKAASHLFHGDIIATMNPDAVFVGPNPLRMALNAWEDHMDALLLCTEPPNALGSDSEGDFSIQPDGRLRRGAGLVYTGVQIMRLDLLDLVNEQVFSLNRVWDIAAARGGLHGLCYTGKWCDVGHPAGLDIAAEMLARA